MKIVEVFSEEELYGVEAAKEAAGGGARKEEAAGGKKRDATDVDDNAEQYNSVPTIMCDAWSVDRRRRRKSSNRLQLCMGVCDCNEKKAFGSSSRSSS